MDKKIELVQRRNILAIKLLWLCLVLTIFADMDTLYSILPYQVALLILLPVTLLILLITIVLVYVSKDLEELRIKAEKNKMVNTEEYLESLIYNASDAIALTDWGGKILRANKAFEKIYGWTESEIMGQRMPIIPENLLEDHQVSLEKIKTGGQVAGLETVRQRKDKSKINVSETMSPIPDHKGNIIALAYISRDITERKKTEELLLKSAKLSVIGQLAAGVAHEIRNPLTTLRGFTQLLQLRKDRNQEYCKIMLSEIERINFITSEFIIMAKPHAADFQWKESQKILEDIINLISAQATMNNVEILTEYDLNLPLIKCEENQIKQVFLNIIKNGIEAMPFGGKLFIRVEKLDNNRILLSFKDQGVGILEEQMPRIGEPFYTTKKEGTGLGLIISQKIIENHDGIMEIKSQLNKGTCVNIILPNIKVLRANENI